MDGELLTRGETEALPLFPFERPALSPPTELAGFQQEGPLRLVRLWDGNRAWVVTRYEDVRTLLADNRFSAVPTTPGFPNISEGRASLVYGEDPHFIRMDPPDHTRMRRMLTSEFTLQRVQDMRPMIESILNTLIDGLLAGPQPADIVTRLALPLPSSAMSQLLGVPYEDHDFFEECGARKTDLSLPPGEAIRAGKQLREYIRGLIATKNAEPEPPDDVIGRLIASQIRPGLLSEHEALAMLELILVAGHETTAHSIGLGLVLLLQDRTLFEALVETDDREFVRRNVEEVLRYTSVVQYMCGRIATADVEHDGHLIRKGDGILPMVNQANRDPSRFADPDRFDPSRESKPHVAFGFGVHQCLGQALARLELECVFSMLPKRIPTLRLAVPVSELQFRGMAITYGAEHVPVAW